MAKIEDINLQITQPCGELTDYVHSIWFAENTENSDELLFKILNDGGMGITLNFADDIICQQNSQKLQVKHGGITSGASADLFKVTFTGKVQTVGIRFLPTTSHYFFSCAIAKLANKLSSTSNGHFLNFETLYRNIQKLILAKSNGTNEAQKENTLGKITQVIEAHLIGLLSAHDMNKQSVLRDVIYSIVNDHEITLKELSEDNGISIRQIQRLFKKYVGLPPKSFMRLVRVNNIKAEIAENNFSSLTKLSVDSGYFDQAHFIHDFKMLMEETPKGYHKLKLKMTKP